MRIPVLIEPLAQDRFRAVGPLEGLSAEGRTSDEARQKLETLLQERLSHGVQLAWIETQLEAPVAEHPLAKHAGTWRDDPMFGEYQQAVEEYRRQRDEQDAL